MVWQRLEHVCRVLQIRPATHMFGNFWEQAVVYVSLMRVLPLTVVDNSNISPNRLTAW